MRWAKIANQEINTCVFCWNPDLHILIPVLDVFSHDDLASVKGEEWFHLMTSCIETLEQVEAEKVNRG